MELRIFTAEELKIILAKHLEWLQDETKGERADLSWSNLSGSDLSRSNLSWSDLSGSNLSGSNLSRSNLSGSKTAQINGLAYPCYITPDKVRFGCKNYSVAEWLAFTDDEFLAMDYKKALRFARSNSFKPTLELAKEIQKGETE